MITQRTYTREDDNEYIVARIQEFAKATAVAVAIITPGIAAVIVSVLATQWVSIAAVTTLPLIAPWAFFRFWRIKRSNLWTDGLQRAQERSAASRDIKGIFLPVTFAAIVNGAVLAISGRALVLSTGSAAWTELTNVVNAVVGVWPF